MGGFTRHSIYLGSGPQNLQGPGVLAASNVGYPVEMYQTPPLDLTKLVTGIELVPARPGYIPFQIGTRAWIILSRAGTQTSPPTVQAGSDAAHQNFIQPAGTTPSNANVNASVPPSVAQEIAAPFTTQRIPNMPVFFDLTVAAIGTGGYGCIAKYSVPVFWVAVGG